VTTIFFGFGFAYITAEGSNFVNGYVLYVVYIALAVYLRWQLKLTSHRFKISNNDTLSMVDDEKRAKLRVFGNVVLVYVGGTLAAGVILELSNAKSLLLGRALFRLTIETLHLFTILALCWAFRLRSVGEKALPT